MKWRDAGYDFYYHLLAKGSIKDKDLEPNISGFEYYMDAFNELSTSRSNSMDIGAIPFTAIVEYFKIYPSGEFDEFHYLIRTMDNCFLDFERKKAEAKNKQAPAKKK